MRYVPTSNVIELRRMPTECRMGSLIISTELKMPRVSESPSLLTPSREVEGTWKLIGFGRSSRHGVASFMSSELMTKLRFSGSLVGLQFMIKGNVSLIVLSLTYSNCMVPVQKLPKWRLKLGGKHQMLLQLACKL